MNIRLLFLVVLLAVVCVQNVQAMGVWDSLLKGSTIHWNDASNVSATEEAKNDMGPTRFYEEDTLANAFMMVDFVNTPLYLVALFRWREDLAVYEDGRQTSLTGFEADRIYTQAMFADIVPSVGGEVKFISNVERVITANNNDKDENEDFHRTLDALVVIEFPSGVAFGRMLTNERFQDLTPHKKAGLEYHAIFACELVEGFSRSSTEATASPTMSVFRNNTDDETTTSEEVTTNMTTSNSTATPVSVVDLVDYRRYATYEENNIDADTDVLMRSGKDAAQTYYDSFNRVQEKHGMRTAGIFKIKHSLIEGSDGWDEVRIQTFPSHAALEATLTDPDTMMDKDFHHWRAGVKRATTFQVSPVFVNSLGGNNQKDYLDACASESAVKAAGIAKYDTSTYCP